MHGIIILNSPWKELANMLRMVYLNQYVLRSLTGCTGELNSEVIFGETFDLCISGKLVTNKFISAS